MKLTRKSKLFALFFALFFAFTILGQLMFFQYVAFNSLSVSSLLGGDFVYFGTLYGPKISIALILGGISLLFKNKSWTIIFSFVLDLWIFAELIYWRTNGVLLDQYSLTMVGNMKGFWNSIIPFFYATDWLVLLFTIALWIAYHFARTASKSSVTAVVMLSLGLLIHLGGVVCLKMQKTKWYGDCQVDTINPFSSKGFTLWGGRSNKSYVHETSVLHGFIYNMSQMALLPFKSPVYHMNADDMNDVKPFINENSKRTYQNPTTGMILILFESLENWVVSPEVTPNIWSLYENHDNCMWATKIKRQTKGGDSADGQMIVNTGLLPVAEGAVAFRYPHHTFPSISGLYDDAAIVLYGPTDVWNQSGMDRAYGIGTEVSTDSDSLTMVQLNKLYKEHLYVMAITIASHTPFIEFSDDFPMDLNPAMPEYMRNYINCVHYTDHCLGELVKAVDCDSVLMNTTIVITGDHTIFDDHSRAQFKEYCDAYGEDYNVDECYCPLIIYSPNIPAKKKIEDECYQMDIYPTVLNLIGCGDSYWKGFGVDLSDYSEKTQRLISEDDAFSLSDKLIRANFFEK